MKTFLCVFTLLICMGINAQKKASFKEIGRQQKLYSLSNGRFDEQFLNDTIQQIGSVEIDITTGHIKRLLPADSIGSAGTDMIAATRFLSVDPLTKQYAKLTPYQYASNRPIDGTDLDGKEWKKIETYDPKTGITNIKFQVKVTIINDSKVKFNIAKVKSEISRQFQEAFLDLKSADGKTTYTATIETSLRSKLSEKGFGVTITDSKMPSDPQQPFISGFNAPPENAPYSQINSISVSSNYLNPARMEMINKTEADLARSIVHELIHSGGILYHPFDTGNPASDVDVVPLKFSLFGFTFKTYIPGPNASIKNIVSNILTYRLKSNTLYFIPIATLSSSNADQKKVSPDQANIISQKVETDTKTVEKKN